MTIISAILKRDFIIVASDSLIASKSFQNGDKRKISYPENPKFVAFPYLKCIVSYWGYVRILNRANQTEWEMHSWLRTLIGIQEQFTSIEAFGEYLKAELTNIFKGYSWPEYKKLGIHLTGFEFHQNVWVPELFLIIGDSKDWNFSFSRRTYGDWRNWEGLESNITNQRLAYYGILEKGYSVYNNGDNEMFNTFFNSFHSAIKVSQVKLKLKGGLSKEFFIDLATLPIKQIAKFQNKYYTDEGISVGGKVHAIFMNSKGQTDAFRYKI